MQPEQREAAHRLQQHQRDVVASKFGALPRDAAALRAFSPPYSDRPMLDKIVTWVLALAAAAIAVVLVRREFFPSQTPTNYEETVVLQDWERLSSSGTWIGDSAAPVRIVEFTDFECPFCRGFHDDVKAARERYADSVSFLIIHLPLSMHRFAPAAARAAECAKLDGNFEEYVGALFAAQDSIGLLSWSEIGQRQGLRVSPQFASCAAERAAHPLVTRGQWVADSLGISSTPAVAVNGVMTNRPPTGARLVAVIDSLLRPIRGGR